MSTTGRTFLTENMEQILSQFTNKFTLNRRASQTELEEDVVLASDRDVNPVGSSENLCLTIIVMGASGDLAKKKTFPALYALYRQSYLPKRLSIVGYARTAMSDTDLQERIKEYLPAGDQKTIQGFLSVCRYVEGPYDVATGYQRLQTFLSSSECNFKTCPVGRLFYLALPPSVYPQVCKGLKENCSTFDNLSMPGSWLRLIVEKPFGKDLESSELLATQLGELFPETQLYRIDHYLGKELAQNMLTFRFANPMFGSWWNRHYISSVQIVFKEPFGTEGRGGYFDQFGIIRDVLQNHLMQLLALVAMEHPVSLHPDDIRDEKVKLLRCINPASPKECLLGQYTASAGMPGYLDDPTVPHGSKTPTFAAVKLFVNNERWTGVPFIVRAGKALNERWAGVRIQLKPVMIPLYGDIDDMRNEFVMRFQPGEAMYAKFVVKQPGLVADTQMTELDLSYADRYQDVHIPDAYERLILDCIRGDQQHFVRRDELRAAWAIFTPLLHAIDAGHIDPLPYVAGSRGPEGLDAFYEAAGYKQTTKYIYRREGATNTSLSGKTTMGKSAL